MKIFIDVDDTLYDTSSVLQGSQVAMMLIAELKAPLFDHAREVVARFYDKGIDCWEITARGYVDEQEVQISRQRIMSDFKRNGKVDMKGVVNYCVDKLHAIQHVWKEYYKTDVDIQNSIFIENDLEQVVRVKAYGIRSIMFAPNGLSDEDKKVCEDLDIPMARSWEEIEKIVDKIMSDDKEIDQEDYDELE